MVPGYEVRSSDLAESSKHAVLSRGLGRSYGDASLPPRGVLEVLGTTLADRILAFDEATGWLRAEAGLSLAEVLRVFMPRGWFPAVTPGTKFVTLGGMVASDVHGKNHHKDGCIGNHIRWLKLRAGKGRIVECSRAEEAELFFATLGGMGLTGHVLEVEMRLVRIPSPWILSESIRVPDIDAFMEGLSRAASDWPFTMGWIDCLSRGASLGRGILYCGRWAEPNEAPRKSPAPKPKLAVPWVCPSWVMGPFVVKSFNQLYYAKHWQRRWTGIVHPESFFYPLDAIHHWNRLYGKRGFTQYQCVLPKKSGPLAARRVLELLVKHGGASFLCVIKDCGEQGEGLLSFPMRGISIALDIPIRDNTQGLIDALNEQVIEEGGRVYLTKDSFTRPLHYRKMEPRLAKWQEIRSKWDPDERLQSALSERLLKEPNQ